MELLSVRTTELPKDLMRVMTDLCSVVMTVNVKVFQKVVLMAGRKAL